MHFPITPGASRALELANDLARRQGRDTVDVEHLLGALVLDESRAAEIVAACGLTTEQLQLAFPELQQVSTGQSVPAERAGASATLQLVLVEARRHAALLGSQAEVGTEHLLYGLTAIESPVRELLREYGLEAAVAARRVSEQTGESAVPLPTEIRLAPADAAAAEHIDVLRIVDAAANRCREGVRVVEDFVRFTLGDRHLTELLKSWRHELADACRLLDAHGLLAARDTQGDVGTTVHTRQERKRGSSRDVVRAAFKRVQEASRTLEEYGKLLSADFAERVGRLRYRVYTLEKAVLTTVDARERLEGCDLYLLLTQELCPNGAGPVVRAALEAGVGAVQVREKKLADRELLHWARLVREWTSAAGALFIMNDRPDLAVLADADGVHVGQDELSVHDARRIVGPERLVGVSTHSLGQAQGAVLEGADYIGVGPVFPSTTKAFGEFAGLDFVRHVAAEIALPAFAIGGITTENVAHVRDAGVRRIAVSGAICAAKEPGKATRELLARLREED